MFTPSEKVGKASLRGRRFIVVDLENVVGGAVRNAAAVLWAKQHVVDAVGGLRPSDQIVIGVGRASLLPTGCTWTNLRYVVGSGVDGADHALLDVLEEDIATRFAEVVVVSGDGIFAHKVAELAGAGTRVTVVAHRDKLAKRLRLAAHHVSLLTESCYPSILGDAA